MLQKFLFKRAAEYGSHSVYTSFDDTFVAYDAYTFACAFSFSAVLQLRQVLSMQFPLKCIGYLTYGGFTSFSLLPPLIASLGVTYRFLAAQRLRGLGAFLIKPSKSLA